MIVSGFVKTGINAFLSADEDTVVQESNDKEYVVMDSDSKEADQSDECAFAQD